KPELSDEAFVEYIEGKASRCIAKHDLLDKGQKVAVAVSGGKDSTAVLHMLLKFGYSVEAVTADAKIGCYTDQNLKNIRKYCDENNVELHEISFREEFGSSLCYLQSVLKAKNVNLKSCTTCGVLRRTLLNKKVREIGADVLVTGHNLDDEAQSFVMNLFKNTLSLAARGGPKTGMVEVEGLVQRVKPLYFISNNEVIRYSKIMKFPVYYGECPCSTEGQRSHVKHWLNDLEKDYPDLKGNAIEYFMAHRDKIRELVGSAEPNACGQCGEPCARELCKSCQILNKLSVEA
ncbi:MAG: TIGR00269 family protein, partial [Candidatus Nanoarchaeia archaeon]